MKELSLNILDIAENSVKAGATLIKIEIEEDAETLTLTISDDGCGMTPEILRGVTDPFYTTRTTRKVGMGLPLLKMEAELTGGGLDVTSRHESDHPSDHGTEVAAKFYKNHIDFTPMGDIVSTIETLIQGNPEIDILFSHKTEEINASLDTRELREILGNDVSLGSYEVIRWIREYLREQYNLSNKIE